MDKSQMHRLAEKGREEFHRFLVMFLYLWVVFGFFVLNESLVLGERHIAFAPQGFALINAAIMAKVMLIAEDLKIGRRFENLPLIWTVVAKSAIFAVVFMLFHIAERVIVGELAGRTLQESLPHLGGGTWRGRATVWAVLTISLLPFFALREIGAMIGPGRLWEIFFRTRPRA